MKFLTMMMMAGLMGLSVLGQRHSNPESSQIKKCLLSSDKDQITNGDFQEVTCTREENFCEWTIGTFDPLFLPGWSPNSEIEVGQASLYNSNWPATTTTGTANYVSALDVTGNTCIMQKLALKKGTYNLIFSWAAFQSLDKPLDTSKIIVKVNGQPIAQLSAATDYSIQTANIFFVLNEEITNGSIELCGSGTSDQYGATVDNVKLIHYIKCQ